mmetsp:Transcript_84132/g.195623  ORF Transcript_84132/g.195623 Transcript_84132/m.195623 type:complete len:245 (-) Transcript_84132:560-1294(-)
MAPRATSSPPPVEVRLVFLLLARMGWPLATAGLPLLAESRQPQVLAAQKAPLATVAKPLQAALRLVSAAPAPPGPLQAAQRSEWAAPLQAARRLGSAAPSRQLVWVALTPVAMLGQPPLTSQLPVWAALIPVALLGQPLPPPAPPAPPLASRRPVWEVLIPEALLGQPWPPQAPLAPLLASQAQVWAEPMVLVALLERPLPASRPPRAEGLPWRAPPSEQPPRTSLLVVTVGLPALVEHHHPWA